MIKSSQFMASISILPFADQAMRSQHEFLCTWGTEPKQKKRSIHTHVGFPFLPAPPVFTAQHIFLFPSLRVKLKSHFRRCRSLPQPKSPWLQVLVPIDGSHTRRQPWTTPSETVHCLDGNLFFPQFRQLFSDWSLHLVNAASHCIERSEKRISN